MNKLKLVLIGFGGMGRNYAKWIYEGNIENLILTGICCRNSEGQQYIMDNYHNVKLYKDSDEMFLDFQNYEALLIVTPHKEHVRLATEALRRGIHVLCDKPVGIHTKEVKELHQVAMASSGVFAMLFNLRANPAYKKAKDIISNGDIGKINRAIWVCNQWYRTSCYHKSSPWRSTWNGEGGGLLINQCQHNLDIWQWLLGMPDKLYASVDFGSYHDIAVDDSDILILHYNNGMKGTLVTSTGEAPGTNRLEIFGTKGKLTVEDNNKLFLDLNEISTDEFNLLNQQPFGEIPHEQRAIPLKNIENQYYVILKNFTNHILFGEELIASGEEGILALSIANAAYLSSWLEQEISLPMDDELYYWMLEKRKVMEKEGIQ